MNWYITLVYIHIISAVLSIGPLFVLLPIVKKMRTATMEEMATHVTIFQAVITIVKHAGHVVVPTGFLLIWLGKYSWLTSWAVLTLAVMVGSVFFLAGAFKPTLRIFNTPEYHHESFVNKLYRASWIYIILLLIMLWLMVAKPVLW